MKINGFISKWGGIFSLIVVGLLGGLKAFAREIHVTKTGCDLNSGDAASPYLRIGKAAEVAQPGDVILIHSGTWREWVKPARGGTDEATRIVYKAYPGEQPVIKGSEQIKSWIHESGNVWRADIINTLFGVDNPYILTIGTNGYTMSSGAQLTTKYLVGSESGKHHLGNVFLNGESYYEKFVRADLDSNSKSWYTEQSGDVTKIWANFGGINPNIELAEILVRECVFAPSVLGLGYISLDGLTITQAACGWEENTDHQSAMIKTLGGHHWIIQNCLISDAKCSGISSANHSSSSTQGWHTIRNNTIQRCGEAGVSGFYGWSWSVIEGNLFQDINFKKEFGGWEGGAIKFHKTADLTIKGNIFRRIYLSTGDTPGIWADWMCQGTRITGNVFSDIDRYAILIEMTRGVNTIDNNVFYGNRGPHSATVRYFAAEKVILAHNLLVSALNSPYADTDRRVVNFLKPHLLIPFGSEITPTPKVGARDYNNIVVKKSLAAGPSNYTADYNVYYDGATPLPGFDANSVSESDFKPGFKIIHGTNQVDIYFKASDAPSIAKCPLITHDFIGAFLYENPIKQGMEDRYGNPFNIDTDFFGNRRDTAHPKAGPFDVLNSGKNSFTITAGKCEK